MDGDAGYLQKTGYDEDGDDEHEGRVELKDHSRRTDVVDRGKDALEDKGPGYGVGQGVIVEVSVTVSVTKSLFDQKGRANEYAMQNVRNVGGEKIEREVAQNCGRDEASLVVEANITVAGDAH